MAPLVRVASCNLNQWAMDFKGNLARKQVREAKDLEAKRAAAVLMVQCAYRSRRAWRAKTKLRDERLEKERQDAWSSVQAMMGEAKGSGDASGGGRRGAKGGRPGAPARRRRRWPP